MSENSVLDRCPQSRPGLLISGAVLRGARTIHLVKDPVSGNTFEIGAKERFIIDRLDGVTPLRTIGEGYAQQFGRSLDTERWVQILGQLYSRSLLVIDPAYLVSTPEPPGEPRRSTLLRGDWSVVGPAATGAIVERVHHAVRGALSPWIVVPLVALVTAMEIILILDLGSLTGLLVDAVRDPGTVLLLLITLWISAGAHEVAHGVVAHRFGGTVTGLGVYWRLPMVLMYCRVENYLFLARRWHQIATALAGTYANLLVLVPFFVVWLGWEQPDRVAAYLAGVLVFGSLLGLVNLVPLAPLDGYVVLSHALGVSGLSTGSRDFSVAAVQRFFGRGPGIAAYSRRARLVYTSYLVGSTLVVLGLITVFVLGAAVLLPGAWGGWRFALPIFLIGCTFAGIGASGRIRRSSTR